MDSSAVRSTVAANLGRVKEMIGGAAERRGIDIETIKLICVTKYAEDEWVEALLASGATDLGENLLPKGADRFDRLQAGGAEFNRHLIGAPQSRKVKLIPGHFDLVQAVDRLKIAEILNGCCATAGLSQEILLQVNIAGEEQKHGVDPAAAQEAAAWIVENCPHLALRGLMAVPPWPNAYGSAGEYERETRKYFTLMKELFDKISGSNPSAKGMDTLSLGMSQDFAWAIEEGATMVRVGSLLYEGLQ